ncbi:MAG: class I SAM-dependent methyltransferase [Planctomycetota bacterium]
MRTDALKLEEERLDGVDFETYPWLHERHRVFPAVLLDKPHGKILDLAAGMGVAAKRIQEGSHGRLICNDISPSCLRTLKQLGLETVSFDLDDPDTPFPFSDEEFDAVISLATLEHIVHLDHHMTQIWRILKRGGHLFISVPNYSGIQHFLPYVFSGESFHDPLSKGIDRYEFYAHVRYFTYKTLLRFVRSFGFEPREVYLPLPQGSSWFSGLKRRSRLRSFLLRMATRLLYTSLSPRWALHPVLCLRKADDGSNGVNEKPRKIIL